MYYTNIKKGRIMRFPIYLKMMLRGFGGGE